MVKKQVKHTFLEKQPELNHKSYLILFRNQTSSNDKNQKTFDKALIALSKILNHHNGERGKADNKI